MNKEIFTIFQIFKNRHDIIVDWEKDQLSLEEKDRNYIILKNKIVHLYEFINNSI